MKTKRVRQGLQISLNDLYKLEDSFLKQMEEEQIKLGNADCIEINDNQIFQINIINDTPEQSDTWRIE